MVSWKSCAALAATMTLGLAANAQAAVATFSFADTTGRNATGILVIKDYVPSGGTFVSWSFFDALGSVYQVNASDVTHFSHNLANGSPGSFEIDSVVRIESTTSLFETGLPDQTGGVALVWNSVYSPVCDPGIPCGGGDGPQVDNGPPFTYTWTLDSLSVRGAVPEPMTWALMIGGFGAIGTQLRARRRRVA